MPGYYGDGGPGFGHFHGGPGFGGPDPLVFLLGALFWIVVPSLIAYAVTTYMLRRGATTRASVAPIPATELLRRRYVMGEIDVTTFENMMERLLASEAREEHMRRLLPEETYTPTLPSDDYPTTERLTPWE